MGPTGKAVSKCLPIVLVFLSEGSVGVCRRKGRTLLLWTSAVSSVSSLGIYYQLRIFGSITA